MQVFVPEREKEKILSQKRTISLIPFHFVKLYEKLL